MLWLVSEDREAGHTFSRFPRLNEFLPYVTVVPTHTNHFLASRREKERRAAFGFQLSMQSSSLSFLIDPVIFKYISALAFNLMSIM